MDNFVLSPIQTDVLIEKIAERTAQMISNNRKPQQQPKDLITRKEAADLLKINVATLWRWTKSGKLHQYGIGGRTYYKRSEILESVKSISNPK